MTARTEQETVITMMRDDDYALLYTSNTSDLYHLRKLAQRVDFVTEVEGGADWGSFTIRAENVHVLRSIRAKRTVSEATRAKYAANAAKAQAARQAVSS